jgi:hypothetical protein
VKFSKARGLASGGHVLEAGPRLEGELGADAEEPPERSPTSTEERITLRRPIQPSSQLHRGISFCATFPMIYRGRLGRGGVHDNQTQLGDVVSRNQMVCP